MTRVVIFGGGRMGCRVAQALAAMPGQELAAVISLNRPDWLKDAPWFNGPDHLDLSPDLMIDFSLPGGTHDAAEWCRANLVPLVSGTTGLGEGDLAALRRAAELIPVLWAPNLSRGVNLLLRSAAEMAASLPAETPVEILDVHHVHKKDAPSGTALMLAHAIARARGQEPDECIWTGADSPGPERPPATITCLSRREGETIGRHRVTFFAGNERIDLVHAAGDRAIYATGAIEAGLWLVRQEAGLYSAANWLAG
jgi:4-hydroxy-tetrahydrodipicolinate reductase